MPALERCPVVIEALKEGRDLERLKVDGRHPCADEQRA